MANSLKSLLAQSGSKESRIVRSDNKQSRARFGRIPFQRSNDEGVNETTIPGVSFTFDKYST
jgi:hypothetical protein